MVDDLSNLDELLAGEPSAALVNPAVIDDGAKIVAALWNTGCEAWGVLLNRGVMHTDGAVDFCEPSQMLGEEAGEYVVSLLDWSGDRRGTIRLVIPSLGAREVVAYFMALMDGAEANPEEQALDTDGLDAYNEAMRSFIGQAAQALREDPGGQIKLELTNTEIVHLDGADLVNLFGEDMQICSSGQFTIEGAGPNNVYTVMSPSLTGHEMLGEESGEESFDFEFGQSDSVEEDDTGRVLGVSVPISVVVAERKMQMENLMDLKPGSIIEFRKSSEELLPLWANNVPIAEGEVVTIHEHFGLQIRRMLDVRASFRRFS